MILKNLLAAATILVALNVSASTFADSISLRAELKSKNEVPENDSLGHGRFLATYDASTKKLKYTAWYADLTGPATMAHIHGPAPKGQNAGVVVAVPVNNATSLMEGSTTLTSSQEKELMAGHFYFNVHTEKHPGGEVRGQIEKTSHK